MDEFLAELTLSELTSTFEFEKCKSFAQRARTFASVQNGFTFADAGSTMQLDDQALKRLYDATEIKGPSSTVKLSALLAEVQPLEGLACGAIKRKWDASRGVPSVFGIYASSRQHGNFATRALAA